MLGWAEISRLARLSYGLISTVGKVFFRFLIAPSVSRVFRRLTDSSSGTSDSNIDFNRVLSKSKTLTRPNPDKSATSTLREKSLTWRSWGEVRHADESLPVEHDGAPVGISPCISRRQSVKQFSRLSENEWSDPAANDLFGTTLVCPDLSAKEIPRADTFHSGWREPQHPPACPATGCAPAPRTFARGTE